VSHRFTRAAALGLTAFAVGASAAIAQGADLTGTGSRVACPIYSKWASIYAERTGVKINYQRIGSSGGIRQLSDEPPRARARRLNEVSLASR
jgi:ABC-type phosphate transport system substrate-binding protein